MKNRRLLVIANSFPDKADTHPGGIFIKEQVRAIAPHLEEVHVVFPSTFGLSYKPRKDFQNYSFGNVHVHFLPYLNVPLFLRVFKRGFAYLMAGAVDRLVRREGIRFDVVHAHFTWPSGMAAVRLKEGHGAPVVVTEHTSVAFEKALAEKDPEYIGTWLAADAVIRVREGDIGRMHAAGVPTEKLHFIPNGFDGSKFHPMDKAECQRSLGIAPDKMVLVNVASLHEVKGQRHLIGAMARVVKTRKDVVCFIVGGGPLETTLQGQIDAEGLGDAVKLVGVRPHDEIACWMGASDLVVHPSLSEGNPVVMFEALGCGRPFIGTRVGGIPEVVTSGDLGLLCEPGDDAAFAELVAQGLERHWDPAKISSHAAGYTWEKVSDSVLAVYRRLLGETVSGP